MTSPTDAQLIPQQRKTSEKDQTTPPSNRPPADGQPKPLPSEKQSKRSNPLIRSLNRTLGLVGLATKRLRYHPGLSLLALLGVILAVGLITSAGFFAQAVDKVVMRQELAEYSRITGRPPFSARVFVASSASVPLTLERVKALGQNVAGTLSGEVGLPVKQIDVQTNSDILELRARPGSAPNEGSALLSNVNVVYIERIADHMTILAGERLDAAESDSILAIWMHVYLAEKIGVQPGDQFDLALNGDESSIPVRVAGIWQAQDPDDPFWINAPDETLRDKLIVRSQDYQTYLEPLLPVKVRSATWRVVLDEQAARPAAGRQYKSGFDRAKLIIPKYLPDARITTPGLSLEKFVQRQTTLTTLLLGFNVPALGFLLYFLVLTSAVIAYWQRREIAIMVSRGMSRLTVLNFTFIEGLILFLVGCPLGLGFGILLAKLMGNVSSFLSFHPRPPLPVSLQGLNLPLILLTLGIVLVAKLWTSAFGGSQSVVLQEREHTRTLSKPFWYRNYLDLLLILPTIYAYNQLVSRGSLAMLVQDRPEDLYRDPLLILVPALFIVSMALVAMRLFPLVMRILDWLSTFSPWLPLHLALRQLGRQSHTYINPLLLVIVSLALGVYTFSMADSLDQWLIDRIAYRTGADVTFEPFSESEALNESQSVGADWIPPIDEFSRLPGVAKATRVGDYLAEVRLADGDIKGRFLGVDRVDFPQVAWFRSDLARESLGGLMNRLALSPENILVSQKFLRDHALQIGDAITIHVITDFGASLTAQFTVAGTYDYFPTVYEEETMAVVGNLDYLFSFFGLTMPHNIWMRLQPGADGEAALAAVSSTGIEAIREKNVPALVAEAQAQMERVGVFGTLSVSFLASAIMAALGLLTYSYASLHERLFHFSVLRAMGLRRRQLVSQVILEYGTLTLYGALAGVFIGSFAAVLFVPLFRVAGGSKMPLPPLLPVVAQEQIVPLALIFAGAMILLELVVLSTALYRRIFIALRMGYQG